MNGFQQSFPAFFLFDRNGRPEQTPAARKSTFSPRSPRSLKQIPQELVIDLVVELDFGGFYYRA